MRLNLGSNIEPKPGWINLDIEKYQGVNVVADLERPWPFRDKSLEAIRCIDVAEHLRQCYDAPNPELAVEALRLAEMISEGSAFWPERVLQLEHIVKKAIHVLVRMTCKPVRRYGVAHFMNEAWRVLKHGGVLEMQIPSTDGRGWSQDPTHVSYWNENSFAYFVNRDYLRLYPHLVKCRWRLAKLANTPFNDWGITWVKAVLHAVHEEDESDEEEQ